MSTAGYLHNKVAQLERQTRDQNSLLRLPVVPLYKLCANCSHSMSRMLLPTQLV